MHAFEEPTCHPTTTIMKKTFKSKIDLPVLLPIIIVFLTAEIFMIVKGIVIGVIAITLLSIFISYLCIDTRYITNGSSLRIKSGFLFDQEIYIKSIKRVSPVKQHGVKSPALSFDRLEICFNRYGRIIISPNNQKEFIRELTEVNPRIRVEEAE